MTCIHGVGITPVGTKLVAHWDIHGARIYVVLVLFHSSRMLPIKKVSARYRRSSPLLLDEGVERLPVLRKPPVRLPQRNVLLPRVRLYGEPFVLRLSYMTSATLNIH